MTLRAEPFEIGRRVSARAAGRLPYLILIAAVTFNAFFAIVNAHVAAISPELVILAEICLVAAVHLYALFNYRPSMAPWYLLLGVTFILFLLRWLGTGEMEPKFFRDVALIPTFIILGLASDGKDLDRVVLGLLASVVVIGVIEIALPTVYSDIFSIRDYYIATRGNVAEDFYAQDSTLFVSATRPDERFLSFLDAPRLSSIFLEPVSLGNFCTITVAYLAARYKRLSALTTFLSAMGIIFLLIGSDGRLAAVSIILALGMSFLAPHLPRVTSALYLPIIVFAAVVFVLATNASPGADDFSGRLAHTVDLLARFQLGDFAGLPSGFLPGSMDSGIAYLILTQSLIGTTIIWLFLVCFTEERTTQQIRYTHGILLYFVLTMTVSYSMLTIKTASLAWFIHGVIQKPELRFRSVTRGGARFGGAVSLPLHSEFREGMNFPGGFRLSASMPQLKEPNKRINLKVAPAPTLAADGKNQRKTIGL